MELALASNWQHDLIPRLGDLGVAELYGQLASDAVGGGRPTFLLPRVSRRRAAQHVREARRSGRRFTYLLNALCLGNAEVTRAGQREIRLLLDWLCEIGVDGVTVSVPLLVELIKKSYPGLKVGVSTQAGVNSLRRARFWEDLGADRLTLSVVEVNRNFAVLRQIRAGVSCQLQLIANLLCLHGCPFSSYHAVVNAHASQARDPLGGYLLDYCTLRCTAARARDPVELIRAPFIRPEDAHHYAQAGIDGLKLVDRGMTTDALLRIAEAYARGRHEGDLMDLLPHPSKNLRFGGAAPLHTLRHFFRPRLVNVLRLARGRALFTGPRAHIDNRALDGFIDFFLEHDCSRLSCEQCNHCGEAAARALTLEPGRSAGEIDAYLGQLASGEMFRYR